MMLSDPNLGPEVMSSMAAARDAATKPLDGISDWYDGENSLRCRLYSNSKATGVPAPVDYGYARRRQAWMRHRPQWVQAEPIPRFSRSFPQNPHALPSAGPETGEALFGGNRETRRTAASVGASALRAAEAEASGLSVANRTKLAKMSGIEGYSLFFSPSPAQRASYPHLAYFWRMGPGGGALRRHAHAAPECVRTAVAALCRPHMSWRG